VAADVLQVEFADGVYNFKLTLHGIKEIQDKCGCGIGAVWKRLHASRLNFMGEDHGLPQEAEWRIEDILEPIRQGLIGGGEGEVDGEPVKVNSIQANKLIERYVMDQPLQSSWSLAYMLVAGLIEGYDPPKKKLTPQAEATDGLITEPQSL
jgi:hypothetical protein